MASQDELRGKLITYLQDLYALETQIVETLEHHAQQAASFPELQQRIEQHRQESMQHRDRLRDRLTAYGTQPQGGKSALTGMMGNMVGSLSGMRTDHLAMNARDEYVTEHMEIASYGMMLATASAYGDQETAQVCLHNLQDELAMAQWLEQHIAFVALQSLVMDGIDIPDQAVGQAQQMIDLAMQQGHRMMAQKQTPRIAEQHTAPAIGVGSGSVTPLGTEVHAGANQSPDATPVITNPGSFNEGNGPGREESGIASRPQSGYAGGEPHFPGDPGVPAREVDNSQTNSHI